jgi:C4-dicarboxylate-specific signal transduction histidine kinase
VISTTLVDGDYILQVDDNGPGLPNKPDGWIWERDNSTRGTEGGSGLGLWIVQDIARGMGGWATAAATKKFGTGAEFRIAFPGVGAK